MALSANVGAECDRCTHDAGMSFDDDRPSHVRMQRAEIAIRSRFAQFQRIAVVRAERLRANRRILSVPITVCGASSSFIHVSSVPTVTVSVFGSNVKLPIVIVGAGFRGAVAPPLLPTLVASVDSAAIDNVVALHADSSRNEIHLRRSEWVLALMRAPDRRRQVNPGLSRE